MEDTGICFKTDSDNYESSSSIVVTAAVCSRVGLARPVNDLGDHLGNPYTLGCQTKQPDSDTFGVQAYQRTNELTDSIERKCSQCVDSVEPLCHVKLGSLAKLKDSTRKLLSLLDEIQTTTNLEPLEPIRPAESIHRTSSIIAEEDDCSVYKRLTRKCHCLNQYEYNDFIIHFNETTKYFTSTIGEIIKNMRIVKKFVYMGGDYTKHALMFLNEGLSYSSHVEKVDIAQGCAHADLCNVFDDQSIVVVCIAWPCIDDSHGDATTQSLAATFLNKLARLEEGRRYLKFSSKITNDLKKVVRKKSPKLEYDTLESINDTLNLLNPPILAQHTNVTYYCKPVDEGFGSKTMNTLIQYREYMTLEEVFTHLDLLYSVSNNHNGKTELASLLPTMLKLFTCLLMEYDDSEMNIIITNILNNVVSKNMIKPKMSYPKTVIMAETATEPIKMRNQSNQVPVKPIIPSKKVINKSKLRVNTSPTRFKQPSKLKGWEFGFNKSKKFEKDPNNSVIVVPVFKSK